MLSSCEFSFHVLRDLLAPSGALFPNKKCTLLLGWKFLRFGFLSGLNLCYREELEVQQAAYLKTLDKYETEHLGNFRRVYPRPGMEIYEKFFHSSGSLFQETAAYKARSEAARYYTYILSTFTDVLLTV